MYKQEFLDSLGKRLSGLPKREVEERLRFYAEMIEDRIEEGLEEEAAVAAIGSVEEIAEQIIADSSSSQKEKKKARGKRRPGAWEIVLLVLGSPIWLSLIIAAFAILLAIWAVLWSVVVSLWAIFASLIGCALGGLVAGIGFGLGGHGAAGMAMIGAGFICAGLSVFLFFGAVAATKGIAVLTQRLALGVRACFVGKEKV